MAVNIYAKVFLLLFSCFIARNRTCSTNNNLRFSDCESGVYQIISLCVELCKDTKYNLWECRRVLQTVVKYMT